LVFGQLAKELRQESSLFAYDLSGHGASKKCESVEELKIEKLVEEGVNVFQDILVKYPGKYVFIGHSLGGSIASQVAEKVNAEEILGVVMIDTIEGAAIKSESSMVEFLTERPK
jgi:protein phosphatase methylesterase 1